MSKSDSDRRLREFIERLACDTTFHDFLNRMASDSEFVDQTMREIFEKGVIAMEKPKKTVVVTGPKTDPAVEALLSAFYRAQPAARADFEPALREAIAKAEQEKRVSDSIKLKLALLSLRSKDWGW